MHCADDAERNSDHDRKAERQSRKLGGDRNARRNLLERGSLGYVGIAKVAVREPADPGGVLDDDRLIETELRLDLRLFPRINIAGRVVQDIDDIAGHYSQQREDDYRYPEQGEQHQEEAPHQVSTHGLYPFISAAADRIRRAPWEACKHVQAEVSCPPSCTANQRGELDRNGWRCRGAPGRKPGRVKHARASFESMLEPDVLEAPAVVGAVRHDRDPLHPRRPAGRPARMQDDRSRYVLLQLSVDLPNQLLALFQIRFRRLQVEQLLELLVAIVSVIALRSAAVILIEVLVRIVDRATGEVEPHRVVLARDLAVPVARFHHFELAVDVDVLELIDQDDRGIAIDVNVSRRDLYGKPFVRTVAELLHQLARLRTVRLDVRAVTPNRLEHLRWHPPHARWRWQHGAPDVVFAFGQDVDECLAVERERHGAA